MTDAYGELLGIADELERLVARSDDPEVREPIMYLDQAANRVGRAWSGSWIGYHANVYYRDFQSPPAGAHFSAEWGNRIPSILQGTTGDWVEQDPEGVSRTVHDQAGNPNMSLTQDFIEKASNEFSRHKADLLSIIDIELSNSDSDFLASQRKAATDLSTMSQSDVIETLKPRRLFSRDALAISQGLRIPPHIRVLAQVWCFQTTTTVIGSLAGIIRLVAKHIYRERQRRNRGTSVGDRVFIGHGRSRIWHELKDFCEDRLGLLVDEFNMVPTAGTSIVGRLQIMLDSATMAFLIMTGEDEQPDGTHRARENVVHEAGLFQGRLGFERSIVLLEQGCNKFSNNAGLVHITFPKDNIRAVFQDVREVLEREGVITTGAAP